MTPSQTYGVTTFEPRETVRLDCPFNPHIVRVEQMTSAGWAEYTWASIRLEGKTVVLLGLPRGRYRVTVLGLDDPKE